MKTKVTIVLLLIIVAGISFAAGAYYGADKTTDWLLNLLWRFMEEEKIDIEIDRELLKTAIFQYKNQIDDCLLFCKNASIPND